MAYGHKSAAYIENGPFELLGRAKASRSTSRSWRVLTEARRLAVVECALQASLEEVARTHGWPRDESGRTPPVAVVGLGKFGGREMGYASDIELVVVYGSGGRTERSGVDAAW